jgi:hypothetical protein
VGTTVLQSFTLASTEDVEVEWSLVKGTTRFSSLARCTHDGVTPVWTESNIAVSPGVVDADVSFDISGGNLRLLGTASTVGWTARWRVRQITT